LVSLRPVADGSDSTTLAEIEVNIFPELKQ
jgi:hypothetical protein